nr:hypothetical protein GCM10020241_08300 [Streptoalloteichus tenebrarius]
MITTTSARPTPDVPTNAAPDHLQMRLAANAGGRHGRSLEDLTVSLLAVARTVIALLVAVLLLPSDVGYLLATVVAGLR